jgi:uncharacterized membrane protein
MIQNVEEYLAELKKDLSGCDKATVQDALSDAEEYLRTALANAMTGSTVSETEALPRIIEKYGSPDEIAAAYRETESRTKPALATVTVKPQEVKNPPVTEKKKQSSVKYFFGVFADPVAWGSFLYLLFSLATGILYFTWAVTGLSLSAGLLVLIIGLPFLALFILSVRGIGLVEGRIVEALLGVRMPRRQIYSRGNLTWWERFKNIVTDKQTWFSIVYMIIQMPLGIIYFTVLVTLFSVALFGIALPILQLGFDIPFFYINHVQYFLVAWMFPLTVIAGILLAFATMNLARYAGRMHGALAKSLLVRA